MTESRSHLVIEGRNKMANQLGTGEFNMFNEIRQSAVGGQQDAGEKRVRQSAIGDEVSRAYADIDNRMSQVPNQNEPRQSEINGKKRNKAPKQ